MRKRSIKILSLLLTLVLILGLMPGMSLTAWADDPYSSLKNTTTVVKFDGKDWYLIDYDSSTVTLLAKECVGASVFGSSNTYSGSTVETYVNNWYSNNISTDAQKAVNGSGAFLLTSEQASALTSDVKKCSKAVGASADFWWLCSPGANDGGVGYAMCVYGQYGVVDTDGNDINNPEGVRPALKLDLSKVTFDSTTNTFSLKPAGYTVTLSGGANAATSGGATTQSVTPGQAMTTVTYTANNGYTFPAFSNSTTNGVTLTRASDTVVTVSGTPTADVSITVPNAAAVTANAYTVTYAANNGSGDTQVYGPYDAGTTYTVEGCSFAAPEGKVFDCWLGSDGSSYRVGAPVVLNANLILTAQWKDTAPAPVPEAPQSIGPDIVFIGGAEDTWEYVGGQQHAWKASLAPMVNGSATLVLTTGEGGSEMNIYPQTSIRVIPNPDPGYTLDKIVWSLIDGSASYDITEAQTFVMPAMDVVVYVTFQPAG